MKLAFSAKGADYGGSMPFFFNLSRPVGKGYPNAPFDDVGFVQFCFAALAANTVGAVAPALKDPLSKVKVTGLMDGPTQTAIDAWQQHRRNLKGGSHVEIDGIFSVAPPTMGVYAENTPYSIVGINFLVMAATLSMWPRLDKHPLAGPVADSIRKAISPDLTA